MTRPMIFFEETNVMLIRESDVPDQPVHFFIGGTMKQDEVFNKSQDQKYEIALEAAKTKAIRVENAEHIATARDMLGTRVYSFGALHIHLTPNQTYQLPEGYTYEVQRDCKRCGVLPDYQCNHNEPCDFHMPDKFPPNSMVAIIKPVVKPESEDELWKIIDKGRTDNRLTIHILEELKSKFNITRKP